MYGCRAAAIFCVAVAGVGQAFSCVLIFCVLFRCVLREKVHRTFENDSTARLKNIAI